MEDRKARLAALSVKAGRGTIPVHITNDNGSKVDETFDDSAHHEKAIEHNMKRKIRFRNYIPSDPKLMNKQMDDDENINLQLTAKTETKKPRTDDDYDVNAVDESTIQRKETNSKSTLQIALEKARLEISNHTKQSSNDKRQITPSYVQDTTTSTSTTATTTINSNTPKINADLKRKIQSKLDLLEKRTQKALVRILRERLEREAATSTQTTTTTTTTSKNNDLD
jgi:hypothetical protein